MPYRKRYRSKTPLLNYDKGGKVTESTDWDDLANVWSTINSNNGCALSTLNDVDQGSGEHQRTADEIWMKSVRVNVTIELYGTTAVNQLPVYITVALILDRRPRGTAPTLSEIFTDNSANQTVLGSVYWPNMEQGNRFKILAQRTKQIKPPMVANQGSGYQVELYRKLNTPVQFIDDEADLASLGTNAIYLFTKITSPITTGAAYNMSWNSRIRYIDT